MTTENKTKVFEQLNWRRLLGEFVVIVAGVLVALWVDQLQEARINAKLEVEYMESLIADLDSDLAQFDGSESWMHKSEAAAATVLSLYQGKPPTENMDELVKAVESAGWQAWPSINRSTLDRLRSTGDLRLIREPSLVRAISDYYATVENVSIPNANMRDKIWAGYDSQVKNVLSPGVRLEVLQRPDSFGNGIKSDAITASEPPSMEELTAALKAFPQLEIEAGEVLYLTISSRAGLEVLREAALELKDTLEQWLASNE